jgi:hypothetical protein
MKTGVEHKKVTGGKTCMGLDFHEYSIANRVAKAAPTANIFGVVQQLHEIEPKLAAVWAQGRENWETAVPKLWAAHTRACNALMATPGMPTADEVRALAQSGSKQAKGITAALSAREAGVEAAGIAFNVHATLLQGLTAYLVGLGERGREVRKQLGLK